jgi:hypothetical protein
MRIDDDNQANYAIKQSLQEKYDYINVAPKCWDLLKNYFGHKYELWRPRAKGYN